MRSIPPLRAWNAAAWLLVAANLAPAWGILALGWDAGPLLWFYWLENLVVGVFAALRIALAPVAGGPAALKLFLIPFFCVHYGVFCFVHGALLGVLADRGPERFSGMFDLGAVREIPGIGWLLLALAVSHGWSFVRHYLGGGERARTTAQAEMARPYLRVMVMHVCVILAGAALIFFDAPTPAALALLALKTAVDLRAHFRSHAAGGGAAAAALT